MSAEALRSLLRWCIVGAVACFAVSLFASVMVALQGGAT